MRTIKYIVFHCTATPQSATIESIKNYWKNVLKWKNPGYHVIVKADGSYEELAKPEQICNGVAGYNSVSYHVSYIGGQKVDDRTASQKFTLEMLARGLKKEFPDAEILGHRDFPKVAKACPRFDVRAWVKELGI
jgi:N-acetylmuramoyl-L-alanine amidase